MTPDRHALPSAHDPTRAFARRDRPAGPTRRRALRTRVAAIVVAGLSVIGAAR